MKNRRWVWLGAAIAVLFLLSLMKNGIAQGLIESSVSSAAHVPVRIGSTHLSLLSSSIRLNRLQVQNPRGFPEKLMLDAPLIFAALDVPALFRGRAHLRNVDLEIRELIVVKNRDGKLNINAVKPTSEENAKRRNEEQAAAAKKKPMKLQIDRLKLSIGRVVYKDYSAGGRDPAVQVFDINMRDRVFSDIHEPGAVVSLVMFEALTRSALSRVLSLDTDLFKEGATDTLSKSFDLVSDGSQKIEDTAKGLFSLFN